jgi:RNA polymerase sigma-70 factor (ECF subfamily)
LSDEPPNNSWDERTLVSALKQGSDEAFRVLIRRYQAKLFSVAYGITLNREESLDIVQDVFLKVYEKIHSFREDAKLSTWLHRITVNLCLNWKRRWKRKFQWHHKPIEGDEGSDHSELGAHGHDPETLYESREAKKMLWDQLGKLPEEARVVFVLKEVEGLSYEEIANVFSIKTGTVSSRLFYARKKLRKGLKRYFEEG